MTRVVISQPMFFPWIGMFEQVRLADIYVHYADVQFSKGSFVTRVQIKTAQGSQWMTAPLRQHEALIADLLLDDRTPWRVKHLRTLEQAYARAPFRDEMLGLVTRLYAEPIERLADLNRMALESIADYFGLRPRFADSATLGIGGRSSDRVLAIVQALGGDVYVTGHGARNYLEHERFDAAGIRVEYLAYERRPYPQLHGAFDPHVSILDLVANLGAGGRAIIASPSVYWREFLSV